MSKPGTLPEALRHVWARRISTGDANGPPEEGRVGVVLEAPVTIDVNGEDSYTVLCTPESKQALALGFLYSEGIIDSAADVALLKQCPDDPNVLRVKLARSAPRNGAPSRNLLIVSSCGACGSQDLEERLSAIPRVGDTLRIPGGLLRGINDTLRSRQTLFDACGGTHGVGIFDATGELISCAEDTGRHNALDKAVGHCLLQGLPTAGRGAVLSGRVSLEMVAKCARAGIELITAISAPTSLAVDVAHRLNITLCAFVRETRATVFTHPERIIGAGE